MDIFKEQILKVRKTPAEYILMAAIIIFSVIASVFLFLYSGKYPFFILLIVAIFYGSGKLLGMFSIEYEYIVTNSVIDIDKIISKSSRKRIASFESKDIVRCEKAVGTAPVTDASERFICCDKDDKNAYWILVNKNGKKTLIMFAPNEKIIEAIRLGAPKNIARELFN